MHKLQVLVPVLALTMDDSRKISSTMKKWLCIIKGFTYEQLAEELNKAGIWKAVLGYQRVDFNRRIAMVVEDPEIRTFLVVKGFTLYFIFRVQVLLLS